MSRWTAAVAVAAGVLMVGLAAQERADALLSLVDAERAFARMSVEVSQREAFLANFADEGIWFTPAPNRTKDALKKQPPQAGAAGRVLDWDPVTGDVAASGDLGYTTGPWTSNERRPGSAPGKLLSTGWFFSIWQKQASGWKVVVDCGVDATHSRALRAQAFKRADVRAVQAGVPGTTAGFADELKAADAEFGRKVTASGWAEALRTGATTDVAVYRDGHEPASGFKAGAALLPLGAWPSTWQPSAAAASAAGDLGFTYGAYSGGSEAKPVRGYYLHVWKRTPAGWRLAVDVANVEAAPAPR